MYVANPQGGGLVFPEFRGGPPLLCPFHCLLLCDGLRPVPVLRQPASVAASSRRGHPVLHLGSYSLLHLDSCQNICCLGGFPGEFKMHDRIKEELALVEHGEVTGCVFLQAFLYMCVPDVTHKIIPAYVGGIQDGARTPAGN